MSESRLARLADLTYRRRGRMIVAWVIALAAVLAVAALAGFTKAEVERIWLPFVPWLLVSTALLPERWRRWGLGLQVCSALVVQHLLYTSW